GTTHGHSPRNTIRASADAAAEQAAGAAGGDLGGAGDELAPAGAASGRSECCRRGTRRTPWARKVLPVLAMRHFPSGGYPDVSEANAVTCGPGNMENNTFRCFVPRGDRAA